jgi:hypothetical protein
MFLEDAAREAEVAFVELEGTRATWTPAGGTATRICGIFRRLSELTDIGELVEADGVAGTYNVATSRVPGVALGDAITIGSDNYRIVGREPTGANRLLLVVGV